MAVKAVNIGKKRVMLTAYCPDDLLGLAACDFLLERVVELLNNTPEEELRAFMIKHDPNWAELFRKMDEEGWQLPKSEPYTVDPSNASAEAKIVAHLVAERRSQL